MSELAEQDRKIKRGWARPGSSHDRLIRLLKFGLPALAGLVLALLALVPLEDRREVSVLVDKNKIDQAGERMKVEAAQYRGQDEEGRPFELNARNAVQASSAVPIVDIMNMSARLLLSEGPATITADRARFNTDANKVDVLGPVRFVAADGYQLQTSDVTVDLHDRSLQSQGRVSGSMPLGTFSGDRVRADLPERTVVVEGGATLHINQGVINNRQ